MDIHNWYKFKKDLFGFNIKNEDWKTTRTNISNILLDNYRRHYRDELDLDFLKIINEVTQKMFTPELVGIQPISGPIHTLRITNIKEKLYPIILKDTIDSITTKIKFNNSDDIIDYIDGKIIQIISEISDKNKIIFNQNDISSIFPDDIPSIHCSLAVLMNKESNIIAKNNRRHTGNWAIIPQIGFDILMNASNGAFARFGSGNFSSRFESNHTKHVGILNNNLDIFVDDRVSNEILIGYRSHLIIDGVAELDMNNVDTGIIYCPYQIGRDYIRDNIYKVPKDEEKFGDADSVYRKIVIDVDSIKF